MSVDTTLGGEQLFVGQIIEIRNDGMVELSSTFLMTGKDSFEKYTNKYHVKCFITLWDLHEKNNSSKVGDWLVVRVARGLKSNQYFVKSWGKVTPAGVKNMSEKTQNAEKNSDNS